MSYFKSLTGLFIYLYPKKTAMVAGNGADYDVARNLKFPTSDIIAMGGLECFVKLNSRDFAKVLRKGKILNLNLKLSFTVGSGKILVSGQLKGRKQVQCTRCLCDFETDIDNTIDKTFSIKDQFIDIMSEIVSELAISNEISEICKKSCKGLCQLCGANLNETKCRCRKKMPSPFSALEGKLKNIGKKF